MTIGFANLKNHFENLKVPPMTNTKARSIMIESNGKNYRKKPVVIQAKQWFKEGDHEKVILVYLDKKTEYREYGIKTLEGMMAVSAGDWIITGVKGEHYPCKPDIFQLTYEPCEVNSD